MDTDFDVIVVGARCAGSPLATLLARQGLRVAVAERAEFPRDTLSTHIFEVGAINFLRRLGVLGEVRATGAPLVRRHDHVGSALPPRSDPRRGRDAGRGRGDDQDERRRALAHRPARVRRARHPGRRRARADGPPRRRGRWSQLDDRGPRRLA